MARKTPTIVPAGGQLLPKLLGTAMVFALVVMVVRQPTATAERVTDLFSWCVSVIDGLAAFLGRVGS